MKGKKIDINNIINLLKTKRILAVVGLVAFFLGLLFPYYNGTIFGAEFKGSALIKDPKGKLILILIIVNIIVIFKDYIKKYVPKLFNNNFVLKLEKIGQKKLTLISSAVLIIYVIYINIDLWSGIDNLSKDLGYYLLCIGIIALAGHNILYKNQIETKNNEVDNSSITNVNNIVENNNNDNNNNNNINNEIKEEESIQETKICPNCGAQLEQNITLCEKCGYHF